MDILYTWPKKRNIASISKVMFLLFFITLCYFLSDILAFAEPLATEYTTKDVTNPSLNALNAVVAVAAIPSNENIVVLL